MSRARHVSPNLPATQIEVISPKHSSNRICYLPFSFLDCKRERPPHCVVCTLWRWRSAVQPSSPGAAPARATSSRHAAMLTDVPACSASAAACLKQLPTRPGTPCTHGSAQKDISRAAPSFCARSCSSACAYVPCFDCAQQCFTAVA